jgi:hypothetical protein
VKRPSSSLWRHLGLAALLALQTAYFVYFLHQFRYLPGTDAYYYALQTQSLLDTGHLKVPDAPVLYYTVAFLCRAGLSIEASFKAVLSGIFIIYNAGLWGLVLRLKRASWPLGLLVSVISGSLIAFHVIEFPRLSLGLATVPFWFLLLAVPKKGHFWWLASLLIACSLMHVTLLFLAIVFALAVAIDKAKLADNWARVFSAKNGIIACAGCVLIAVVIVKMWPGLLLRMADLRLGVPGIVAFLGRQNNVPGDLKIVVPALWLLLLAMFVINSKNGSRKWWYLAFAVFGIPFWPSSDPSLLGLSGRLALLFVFVATPLVLVFLEEISDSRGTYLQHSHSRWPLALIAIVIAAILPVRMDNYRTVVSGYDYSSYEKVVANLRNETIPMLIAHRGLDFFYSYRLRRDAFHFDPEPGWKRSNIWRVTMRVTPEEVAYYSPVTCQWSETARTIPDTDYFLVREDCWEQFRANVNPEDNPDLYVELWEDSENPSGVRPAFLRERHRDVSNEGFPAPSGR